MSYNLYRINATDFELIVQALMQKELGSNSIVFRKGPDGARELTYTGKASFSNEEWDGYWVVQAKYKSKESDEDDYAWIKRNFVAEMEKFSKDDYKVPDNYIFITNAVLTAKNKTGGRDKIEVLKKKYSKLIKNIFIGSYDEMCSFLDNNRDVATAYASFILSGDILFEVLKFYKNENDKTIKYIETISDYLRKEFESEQTSKLIHAGDLTHKVSLENVFTDLLIKSSIHNDNSFFAVEYFINISNSTTRTKGEKNVFVGSAGAGKSTITQFITQLYIALFLKNSCNIDNAQIDSFLQEFNLLRLPKPLCYRIPFKIILKDYAGWVNEKIGKESISILNYLKFKINIETGDYIDTYILKDLLTKLSFIFIFDGLDEVPVSSNRDVVLNEINEFVEVDLNKLGSDAVIVATTRPQGYSLEFNREKYKHFELLDMTDEICLSYLQRLLLNIEPSTERRLSYIKTLENSLKNEITSNLMRTPLQATIMAVLVVSGGEPSSNKYALFREYYETIFKREKQKKVSTLINEYEIQIHKIHNYLGYKLQHDTENSSNTYSYIKIDEFEEIIVNFLLSEEWDNRDIERFVEDFRETITNRLVFISEIQEEKVGFVVRSLQEFFAANFYMDASDIDVKERIRQISVNAYWRNTLIFSIGYIRTKKEHLINDVYDLCEELNGADLEPLEVDYRKIIKLGSWLVLDILSEGILNDSPKFVNRFSRLLEPLILLPQDYNHSKFNRLQNRVKEIWVLDKFISSINIDNVSYLSEQTIFYILIQYAQSSEQSIKDKSFKLLELNNTNKTIETITNYFYDSNFDKNLFFTNFTKSLELVSVLSYEGIISEDLQDDRNIFNYFNKNIDKTSITYKVFIENILLIYLRSYIIDEIDLNLYNKITSDITNEKIKADGLIDPTAYISICFEEITITIHNGIMLHLYSINKLNKSLIKSLKKLSTTYNLDYLTSYFNYLLNPCKVSLLNFLDKITHLSDDIKEKFSDSVLDWVTRYIFRYYNKRDKYDELFLLIGETYDEWISYENYLLTGIDPSKSMFFSHSISNSILTIENKTTLAKKLFNSLTDYNKLDEASFLYNIIIFKHVFRNNIQEKHVFLSNDEISDLIYPVLTNTKFIDNGQNFSHWINSWITYFAANDLKKLLKDAITTDCFSAVKQTVFRFHYESINKKGYENIFHVFNSLLASRIDNSMLRLVTLLVTNAKLNSATRINEYIESIDFHSLKNTHYDDLDDKACQFLLMLQSPFPLLDDKQSLLNLFKSLIMHSQNFTRNAFEIISANNSVNSWQKKMVLMLSKDKELPFRFFENSYTNFDYLKAIAESIPIKENLFV